MAELELKLTLFVDDQLGSRVENAAALLVVSVVQVKFARGQIEGLALGVVVGFPESDPAVGGEPDLAAGWRGNQRNVTEVVAKCAGDGNPANWLHVLECFDQTLVLALLERSDEDLPVFLGGVPVDDHLDTDGFTQLGAGTHGGGVNRFCRFVIGRDGGHGRCQEQCEQKTAVAEFPSSNALSFAVDHYIFLSKQCFQIVSRRMPAVYGAGDLSKLSMSVQSGAAVQVLSGLNSVVGFGVFGGVLAEVLLVDDAVLVDDEGRDAGVAVPLRIGDEGETSGHLPVDNVVFRSSLGIGALFGEDAIEVTVERLLLACLRVESFCGGKCYPGPSGLLGCPSGDFQ